MKSKCGEVSGQSLEGVEGEGGGRGSGAPRAWLEGRGRAICSSTMRGDTV